MVKVRLLPCGDFSASTERPRRPVPPYWKKLPNAESLAEILNPYQLNLDVPMGYLDTRLVPGSWRI